MLDLKISPNLQTWFILVTALCNERKIDAANLVLYFMDESNIYPDIVTYNSVIETYCFLGNITKAMSIFDIMVSSDVVPDISTYTTLIYGCCKYDKMDDAMLLFREMNEKGLIPNYLTCITILRRRAKSQRATKVIMNPTKRAALNAFIKFKFKSNCTTRSFLKNPNPTFSLGIGLGPHKTLFGSLIHSNSCLNVAPDPLESAPQTLGEAFDKLTNHPACSIIDKFNKILESLAKLKCYRTSLDMFKQFGALGVTLDNNTVIKCCCQLYRTNEAFSVLGWNLKRASTSIPDTMMYSAGDIFKEMVYQQGISPDVVTYNSLLSGLRKIHCWREASLQLKEMIDAANLVLYFMDESNISLDIVTYNSVIETCCFL
nr:hypothetical protein [Tanacetum cinerariifolium]